MNKKQLLCKNLMLRIENLESRLHESKDEFKKAMQKLTVEEVMELGKKLGYLENDEE